MRWSLQALERSDLALSFAALPSKCLPSGGDGSGGFFNCTVTFALRVKEKIQTLFHKHLFSIYQLFVHDISQEIQRVKGNEPALWEMVGEKKQGKTPHVTLEVTAERMVGDSPGLAAKKPPCEAGDAGSVPGRGTRSPRAAEQLSPCATRRVPMPQEKVPCAAKTRHI